MRVSSFAPLAGPNCRRCSFTSNFRVNLPAFLFNTGSFNSPGKLLLFSLVRTIN